VSADGDASISVVVPNWNGAAVLPDLLAALASQSIAAREIIVVDDGSTDDSAARLRGARAGPRLIELGRNLGFAAAVNRGVVAARGRWVALLNSDARPERRWLEALSAAAAYAVPGSACFACPLLRVDGRLEGAGIRLLRSGFGAPAAAGADPAALRDCEVFGASGGAMLIDRAVFLELGGLDESFFGGFEDLDLACRLRLNGWSCALVAGARVSHLGGRSFADRPGLRARLEFRNAVAVAVKNFPAPLLRRFAPAIAAAHVRALAYLSLRGELSAAAGGEWDLWRSWPRLLRQRSEIQRRATDRQALQRWLER
jgi:GT2 family glycosyltransferase